MEHSSMMGRAQSLKVLWHGNYVDYTGKGHRTPNLIHANVINHKPDQYKQ